MVGQCRPPVLKVSLGVGAEHLLVGSPVPVVLPIMALLTAEHGEPQTLHRIYVETRAADRVVYTERALLVGAENET